MFTFVHSVNIWNNADYCVANPVYGIVLHTNLGVAGEDDVDKTILFDTLTLKGSCWYTIYGNGRTLNFHGTTDRIYSKSLERTIERSIVSRKRKDTFILF